MPSITLSDVQSSMVVVIMFHKHQTEQHHIIIDGRM